MQTCTVHRFYPVTVMEGAADAALNFKAKEKTSGRGDKARAPSLDREVWLECEQCMVMRTFRYRIILPRSGDPRLHRVTRRHVPSESENDTRRSPVTVVYRPSPS
jgi:hypothetical protein